MQQGAHAVENILRRFGNQPTRAFRYHDLGNLATIGRHAAIADFGGRWKFAGAFAWWLWLFIHILYLAKFENRMLVLVQWFWNYITRNRTARLITGQHAHERRDVPGSAGTPLPTSH